MYRWNNIGELQIVDETSNSHVSYSHVRLDVDLQRDDDASPMSTYRCLLRPTWMLISALQHKSKYEFELFWKKIGFPCCSNREDLSIDVSTTNVGLILRKARVISFLGVRTKFIFVNFELFWRKKIQFFLGFITVILVKTFPLMYQLLM